MQHVSAFGYPTPPASPAFDEKCALPNPYHVPTQARYVPVAAEDRLGRFLTSSLRLTGILGNGAYGVVYSAVDIRTNVRYAVKCLSKFNPDGTPLDPRQVSFQTREIRLHYLASAHANVVSMLKIIDNPDCVYVVLEYCPEGDLFVNITERGHYVGKDSLVKSVFLQILDAVEHCHSLGIYHRDLKPENILVTDNGETVKLADFGLATSEERSEDYGCGSTFYMSPECLDPPTRRPYYYCAPNDVWSLGVVLVNLTCGRNPWKQASFEDSTYRAYSRNPDFLRTILPLSDELNDILGRLFTPNPDKRITLPELRARILACQRFTLPERPAAMLSAASASPEHISTYVDCEEAVLDDEYDYDAPLSPAASDTMSDGESSYSSDEGSLTSSCSSIEDLDDDLIEEPPEAKTPPPTMPGHPSPVIYDPEEPRLMAFPPPQDYVSQFHTQGPGSVQPVPVPSPPACAPKFQLPFVWDMFKYAQQTPQLHHPIPFHHQVPLFASLQGCY